MSSFVISKKEYVKAAGIMYGVENSNRFPHTCFLNVVREKFNELYIMNEKSVAMQYKKSSHPDECEYIDLFWEYVEKSKQMLKDNKKELTYNMMIFFNSILYQMIEDEEMHMKASDFLYMCIRKLLESDEEYKKVSDGAAWWGVIKK